MNLMQAMIEAGVEIRISVISAGLGKHNVKAVLCYPDGARDVQYFRDMSDLMTGIKVK